MNGTCLNVMLLLLCVQFWDNINSVSPFYRNSVDCIDVLAGTHQKQKEKDLLLFRNLPASSHPVLGCTSPFENDAEPGSGSKQLILQHPMDFHYTSL